VKPKKVSYRLIAPTSDEGRPLYALLEELVEAHHQDLHDARIALAWCTSWKPDVDANVTLGKCKKASDLDRELAAYDFIILLREAFWTDPQVSDLQRRALLDHELCHAAVACDRHGEPVEDERGRIVYRTRKHEIEDFTCIAERYGCWTRDLQQFARALDQARERSSAWVGYTTLQADLQQAGVWLPLDTITAWTEAERREARTWALLHQEAPEGFARAMPACVAQALEPTDVPPPPDPRLPIGDR
jgi:Putative phage metallopeptidase